MKLAEAVAFLAKARRQGAPSRAVHALPVAYYIEASLALPTALVALGGLERFLPWAVPPAATLLIASALLIIAGWAYVEPLAALLGAGLLGHAHDGTWLYPRAVSPTQTLPVWPRIAALVAGAVTMPLLLIASAFEHRASAPGATRLALGIAISGIAACAPPLAAVFGTRATPEAEEVAAVDVERYYIGSATGTLAGAAHATAMRAGASLVLDREDACKSILFVGETGSGKTAAGVNQLAIQLFSDPKTGVFAFDIKDDAHHALATIAAATSRTIKRIGVDALGLNLLDGLTPDAVGGALRDIFTLQGETGGNSGFFVSQAVLRCRFALEILRALEMYDLYSLNRFVFSKQSRESMLEQAEALLQERLLRDDPAQWRETTALREALEYEGNAANAPAETARSVGMTIENAIGQFVDPTLRQAFCNSQTPQAELADILRGGAFVFSCSRERFGPAARTVMHIAKARVFSAIKSRETREHPVALLMDECQDIMSDADLDFASKSRSFNAFTVAATQSVSALYTALKSHDLAHALLANFGQRIFFRTGDPATSRYINDLLGAAEVTYTSSSDSRDWHGVSRGTSISEQRNMRAVVDAQRLRELRRFESIAICSVDGVSYDDVIACPFVEVA